tara:strand:+ start:41 stop:763 length:723 start_codon:yes stop_codon:yes gene_type:complete
MSFPQTIVGKWGWEQQTSTTQKQKLGTKMQIEDTLYVYGKAGEAITVGLLCESAANISTEDEDLAVATAAAGATEVTVTFGASVDKDEYKDGFLYSNTGGTGIGYRYRIKGNTAATSSVVTLDHEDGLIEAWTNGSDTVGAFKNPLDGILISNTTPVGAVVGVTVSDIASGSYGWLQTTGPGVVKIQGTPAAGAGIMRSDGTTGCVELLAEGSNTLWGAIGHMGRTAGVNNEYHEVWLNI